ncbi:MAG: autotransporter domain-containing protein [Rhodospirillales bacterium]|nr:autotransporter domain-containing protein [Rhodospirillales bacterium]
MQLTTKASCRRRPGQRLGPQDDLNGRPLPAPGTPRRCCGLAASARRRTTAIWRVGPPRPRPSARTPCASSSAWRGFSESGANSLNLNVRQQTTNSLRSTFGADIAGAIGLGNGRSLDMAVRLGWLHEYAYTGRPITAAFAGAPAAAFTVYGATPQRDAAVIGFSAGTAVSDNASVYLRYDGDIGSGTDNHAFNLGLRFSW